MYACLQIETTCGVTQTDTGERCYRDYIENTGEWNVSDTVVIKLQTPATGCRLFGWARSELGSAAVVAKTSSGAPVAGTAAALGTTAVTFTLTEGVAPGETLTFCYRTGIPSVYVALAEDRGNAEIDLHAVDLDNPVSYVEVYGREHQWSGDPALPDILRVTGMGLQTNPPS
jgi:hypothetical protein